jgi:hypothetical protein
MMVAGTPDRPVRSKVLEAGNFRGNVQFFMEDDSGARPAPQAFLVNQAPGWTLPTHYHLEEQFQVVVGGNGTLGRHVLQPVSVHYASRHSGYGPIVAGDQGLQYLTLRSVTDNGVWYLPEERARMQTGIRKRQATSDRVRVRSPAELSTLHDKQVETVIEPDASGLGVWMLSVPPEEPIEAPEHAGGGGRFHVVIAGGLAARPDPGALSCIYVSSDEAAFNEAAGLSGLQLLVLQFPASALEPQAQALPSPRPG